jgi:hypothetical protein
LDKEELQEESEKEAIVDADLPECSSSELKLDMLAQLADLLKSKEVFACSKLGIGGYTALEHKMNTLEKIHIKEIIKRTCVSLVDGDEAHGVEGIVCPLYLTNNRIGGFRRTWNPRGLLPQGQALKDASREIRTPTAEERPTG